MTKAKMRYGKMLYVSYQLQKWYGICRVCRIGAGATAWGSANRRGTARSTGNIGPVLSGNLSCLNVLISVLILNTLYSCINVVVILRPPAGAYYCDQSVYLSVRSCFSKTHIQTWRNFDGGSNLLRRQRYIYASFAFTSRVLMGVRTWQMGSADPPGKMDEKLKSENMQKSSFLCLCYILRAIRAVRAGSAMLTTYLFRYT